MTFSVLTPTVLLSNNSSFISCKIWRLSLAQGWTFYFSGTRQNQKCKNSNLSSSLPHLHPESLLLTTTTIPSQHTQWQAIHESRPQRLPRARVQATPTPQHPPPHPQKPTRPSNPPQHRPTPCLLAPARTPRARNSIPPWSMASRLSGGRTSTSCTCTPACASRCSRASAPGLESAACGVYLDVSLPSPYYISIITLLLLHDL